jgi:hypothetical protein
MQFGASVCKNHDSDHAQWGNDLRGNTRGLV